MPRKLSGLMTLMIQYLFPPAALLCPFRFLPVGVHQPRWLLQYIGPLMLFTRVAGILKKMTKWSCIQPPPARPQVSNARQQVHLSIVVPHTRPSMWLAMMTLMVRVMVGLHHHPLRSLHRMTMSL